MKLFEIKAEIPAGAASAVEDVLLEIGEAGWSVLEDVPSARAWVVGVFQDEGETTRRWEELRRMAGEAGVAAFAGASEGAGASPRAGVGAGGGPGVAGVGAPVVRTLEESDWRDSYRAHFKAWSFGRLHWVPVWERPTFELPAGHAVLWLDPGLAFGTGNHETTRLCIERLVALGTGPGPVRVVDAGCGSGILALSAVRLGFDPVAGFDIDPEAVRVSLENAAMNGLDGRVPFACANLEEGLAGVAAEVVLANIQADILAANADRLVGAVAPGGRLILSGILASEAAAVRAVFERAAPGWAVDSRTLGEWSDLLLARP